VTHPDVQTTASWQTLPKHVDATQIMNHPHIQQNRGWEVQRNGLCGFKTAKTTKHFAL